MQELWIINIFCYLQSIINNLRQCNVGVSQILKLQIYQKAQELVERGHKIFIRCIPGYSRIEGNKRIDKAAKKASLGRKVLQQNKLVCVMSGNRSQKKNSHRSALDMDK